MRSRGTQRTLEVQKAQSPSYTRVAVTPPSCVTELSSRRQPLGDPPDTLTGMSRAASWSRLVIVALLLMTAPAPASGAGRASRLVFEGGDGRVLIADIGRQDVRPVRSFGTSDLGREPTWSPDAREVVYATESCPDPASAAFSGELVSTDVRARRNRVVVSVPQAFTEYPSWSPDGRRLAFGTVTPGPFGQATLSRVMVVNRDGTGLRTVALGRAPSWSPDGGLIALSDWVTGSLVVVDATTGASRQVSPDGVYPGPLGAVKNYAMQPDPATWSRDGRWLAFSGVRSATHAVVDDAPADWHAWVVRTDGSGARQLRDEGEVLRSPSWSPDGKRVVLQDRAGITVASVDGRTTRRIAATRLSADYVGQVVGLPAWSPHGSLIAYEREYAHQGWVAFELRVVRPDGRGDRGDMWIEHGAFAPLRWAPDSPA
jgi:Tol biopolymer transport system component